VARDGNRGPAAFLDPCQVATFDRPDPNVKRGTASVAKAQCYVKHLDGITLPVDTRHPEPTWSKEKTPGGWFQPAPPSRFTRKDDDTPSNPNPPEHSSRTLSGPIPRSTILILMKFRRNFLFAGTDNQVSDQI